jgi:hypothetical protein
VVCDRSEGSAADRKDSVDQTSREPKPWGSSREEVLSAEQSLVWGNTVLSGTACRRSCF